jgi:hypothetical protein
MSLKTKIPSPATLSGVFLFVFAVAQVSSVVVWHNKGKYSFLPSIDKIAFANGVIATTTLIAFLGFLVLWNILSKYPNLSDGYAYVPFVLITPILFTIVISMLKLEFKIAFNATWYAMILLIFITWFGVAKMPNARNFLMLLASFITFFQVVYFGIFSPLDFQLGGVGRVITVVKSGTEIRPTGLTFNAGFLGIAQVPIFFLALSTLRSVKGFKRVIAVSVLIGSLCLALISGSRLPISVMAIGSVFYLILLMKTKIVYPRLFLGILVTTFVTLGFFVPYFVGLRVGNTELSTFSGRLDLWKCVLGDYKEFIPFGVGVGGVIERGFCPDLEWSSGWRHAESISLSSLVETGPVGALLWIVVFLILLNSSTKVLQAIRGASPIVIAGFFVLSQTGGMLGHYIPIVGTSTSRGIFNFFLYFIIGIAFLRVEINELLDLESKHQKAYSEQ